MEGDIDPNGPQPSDAPAGATPPPPPSEPPPYSPPSVATQTPVPPVFEQQFGAPYMPSPPVAAPRRNSRQTLVVIGAVVLVVLVALGGVGVFANAQFSTTYSPQRAVTDYFAAMSKGDVAGMMSNATFLNGGSPASPFFGKSAVSAMMAIDQNKQISDVKIDSVTSISSSTSSVNVTLKWGGAARNLTYQVQKDTSRVHYLFYDSWRVQVPVTTINIDLPNQPGAVDVDGIAVSIRTSGQADVIQGFHKVTMAFTDFYDSSTLTADGVDSSPTVVFPQKFSATVLAAAEDSVKGAFANTTCDTSYPDCPNHQYRGPATLSFPGGVIVANSGWVLVYEGDPTAAMKLTVTTTPGLVMAAGVCGMKMTVDGSRVYHFVGTWSGKLTWNGGTFSSDLTSSCDDARV